MERERRLVFGLGRKFIWFANGHCWTMFSSTVRARSMFSAITKQALIVAGFIRLRWSSTMCRPSLKIDLCAGFRRRTPIA
jgi:hypothetical protein